MDAVEEQDFEETAAPVRPRKSFVVVEDGEAVEIDILADADLMAEAKAFADQVYDEAIQSGSKTWRETTEVLEREGFLGPEKRARIKNLCIAVKAAELRLQTMDLCVADKLQTATKLLGLKADLMVECGGEVLAAWEFCAELKRLHAHLAYLTAGSAVRVDTSGPYFADTADLLLKAAAGHAIARKSLDAVCELLFDDVYPTPPGRVLPLLTLYWLKSRLA